MAFLGRRVFDAEAILARLVALGLVESASANIYVVRRHLGGVVPCILSERGWI